MKIGSNLQRIRKSKQPKITQQELGNITGLSRSYIADVEHNRYNPSLDTTLILADALNVTVNDLVYDFVPATNTTKLDNIINTITTCNLNDKQLELLELYLATLIRD